MQNSNGNDPGHAGHTNRVDRIRVHRIRVFQMILLRNFLHYGWSCLCSVAPLVVSEPNVGYDLPASMREILTGSVRLITSRNQIQIHTYLLDKFRATLSSADSTILVVRV